MSVFASAKPRDTNSFTYLKVSAHAVEMLITVS